MINRKIELIAKIEEKLIHWDTHIKIRSKSGRFDLHKDSENNIRDILNILYGYKLHDLNLGKPNFPIIDLGDSEGGLCFQVTANKSDQSYSELEGRFLNSTLNLKEKYPKLHVFILSGLIDNRKGFLKALEKTGLTDERLLDFKSILDKARDLRSDEDYKLDKILQVLDKNYICYKYFETAICNYKTAIASRFPKQNIFIEPYLIEEEKNPFKTETENKKKEDLDELFTIRELGKISFNKACEQSSQFILTGDAGSGKSEVMKHAFQKKLIELNGALPFYIDLGKRDTEKDIVGLIQAELHKYIGEQDGISKTKLVKALTTQLLVNNALCLLFDGYDEMDKALLETWNEYIRTFLTLYPRTELIIAVRRNRVNQDIVVPINKIYDILPFDDEQIENYIGALLLENGQSNDETRIKFIKTKLAQSRLFLTAPTLIVKMLIQYAAMQAEENITLPTTKAGAYKNYFEYVILKKIKSSGINDAKATIPELVEKLINETLKILGQIAFLNFRYSGEKKPMIDFSPLNTILESIEDKNKTKYLYQKGVNFFVQELQILKFENEEYYFNHYTYQEFFFAYWLKESLKKSASAVRWVKSAYLVAKYNQVFAFLAGLMNESELDRFLTQFLKWPFRFWMRIVKSLDSISQTKFYFIAEMLLEGNISKEDAKLLSDRLFEEIRPHNEYNFERACKLLSRLSPGSEPILKKIVDLVIANGSWVRKQGLKAYALPEIKRLPEFKNYVFKMLNNERSYDRDIAIEIFRTAKIFDDEIVSKILELHFLPESGNENEGFRYMTEYAKKYPDKCKNYCEMYLKKIADKNGEEVNFHSLFLRYYFAHVMQVPGYNEEELEKEVLEYINQINVTKGQFLMVRALYKTGIRKSVVVSNLLEILKAETPLATIIFMYFRDLFIVRSEIIEMACKYLYSMDREARHRAMNYLATIRYDGNFERNGKRIRIAERALEIIEEEQCTEGPRGAQHYAMEYLANIKYTEGNTTNMVIDLLHNSDKKDLHSNAIRYLINTKYYSASFFRLMCNTQAGLGYSWESNQYFGNIEKYIPKNKIQDAKMNMFFFFATRTWAIRKSLKNIPKTDDWTTSSILEDFFKITLALQKIVLYEDEVKQLSKLSLNVR